MAARTDRLLNGRDREQTVAFETWRISVVQLSEVTAIE